MMNHWNKVKEAGARLGSGMKGWKDGARKAGSMMAKKAGEAAGFVARSVKSNPAKMAICIGLGVLAGSAWSFRGKGDGADGEVDCDDDCNHESDWS